MTNENKNRQKVEAIYPLSSLQQGILFHHLTEKQDKGFLIVQSTIDGNLNLDIFKNSWAKTIERHAILRTTVHWENIKSPVQIVNYNGKANFEILDWSHINSKGQKRRLEELKVHKRKSSINFQKDPLSNVTLVKINEKSFILLWICHHLLLDGWSSSIIINDVFKFYQAIETKNHINLPSIPSYKSYLNYKKQISLEDAKSFWQNTFEGLENPSLFKSSKTSNEFLVMSKLLPKDLEKKLEALAKNYQISLNTLFQGLWSLILFKLLKSNDITFGNTVSGRSLDFPNIDLMTGMFTNVIPIRTKLSRESTVKEWLKNIQKQQTQARKFEHIGTNEIAEWVNIESGNLFDNLFIFENFPWEEIKTDSLHIHSSESGITTTFPLTIVINTIQNLKISLLYDNSTFSKPIINWIENKFDEIINCLTEQPTLTVQNILSKITPVEFKSKLKDSNKGNNQIKKTKRPENKTELELLQIWQNMLDIQDISTTDNFFKLGGKSLTAVKMFSLINEKLKVKLSATKLLEYPTIKELSDYILLDSKPEPIKHIVPIRSKGHKKPLFCIHAGGAHVIFYGLLKDYLKEGRPIYALQPSGLNEDESLHKNVEAMAKDYLRVIKQIQPEGPYNILVHCFSSTVGNEMSILLDNAGEKVNLIAVDTMASSWGGTGEVTMDSRIGFFFKRLANSPLKTIKTFFKARYYLIEPLMIKLFGTKDDKQLEKVKASLRKISENYTFKPHNGKVSLILTDRGDKRFINFFINSWENLAKGGVKIYYTTGHHEKLFEKPDIEDLSEKIDLTIID